MTMLTQGMTAALARSSSEDGGASGESGGSAGRGQERSIDGIKAALASIPEELSRLLAGRSREELTQPAQDGGWGIVEILPHFLDWEHVIRDRVNRILTEDTPELEEYDDSLWAIEHDYSSQDPVAVLDAFRDQRLTLVEFLETIDDAAWNRGGVLPKHGGITLHWLLNNVCDHDAKHLMQVKDVLA
jgi:hypothetical protein